MIGEEVLNELDNLGFGSDIEGFEKHIENLQEEHAKGNSLVSDALYDQYIRLLKQLKPNSEIFNRNWETEENELTDYDSLLDSYGMCSITTITSLEELGKFRQVLEGIDTTVDLIVSLKENGHAARAVYVYGELKSGSTRGRYKKGRDITRHLKSILPNYVGEWSDIPLVEIRGEILVSIDNFENHFKGTLKTPLSTVTSLIRESVTDEELQYLDMVCYKVLSNDEVLSFETLEDELNHLKECGFDIPQNAVLRGMSEDTLDRAVLAAVQYFETLMDNGEIQYACDGIVMAINDNELFYSQGKSGNAWNSNIAIKMGKYWESNVYSAEILNVVFTRGKSYMTPKAIIEPLKASNGAEVTIVPLYNIGVMERYGYVPGETIYFRFGGEVGVILCDMYGNSVKV